MCGEFEATIVDSVEFCQLQNPQHGGTSVIEFNRVVLPESEAHRDILLESQVYRARLALPGVYKVSLPLFRVYRASLPLFIK